MNLAARLPRSPWLVAIAVGVLASLQGCPSRVNYAPAVGSQNLFPVGFVYATLFSQNALLEINTVQSRAQHDPIYVSAGPHALAVDPRGRGELLYVVCQLGNTVDVVDRRNRLVNRSINVGNKPFGIALTPDGTRGFVTNENDDTVSVIDLTTETVVDTISLATQATNQGAQQPTTAQSAKLRPLGIATNDKGTNVYVACGGGQLVVLTGPPPTTPNGRYTVARNVLLAGSVEPTYLAVDSSNGNETAYLTDPKGGNLYSYSLSAGGQGPQVRQIQGGPFGLAIGRNPATGKNDRLYVTASQGNALYPLSLPDLSAVGTNGGQGVSVEGKNPTAIAVSPIGDQVYVSLSGTPNIAVLQRQGDALLRPEQFNLSQLDPHFVAPTGDIALGGFLFQ